MYRCSARVLVYPFLFYFIFRFSQQYNSHSLLNYLCVCWLSISFFSFHMYMKENATCDTVKREREKKRGWGGEINEFLID